MTGGLLCIGEMLIDFTPISGMTGSYTANPGGAPANVAVSAARNGIRAGFTGKLGNDDFGKMLEATLKKDKVEILVPELTDEATTTLAFVTLNENGDRSFTFARKPGADMLLDISDMEKIDFSEWDMIHAGSVSQSGSPEGDAVLWAIKKAKELGKLISFDINYRGAIWTREECLKEVEKLIDYVDLLKISDEEADFAGGTENIPQFMKKHGISVVVLTKGKDGADIYYLKDGTDISENEDVVKKLNIPSVKVDAIDTTGAGDAYWGGFLSYLLRQNIRSKEELTPAVLENAGRYGAASGGICVTRFGGIPALPYLDEIEESLSK